MTPNLFPEYKLGEPTPWKAVHRRIEYPGEIIVANSWAMEWGGELK